MNTLSKSVKRAFKSNTFLYNLWFFALRRNTSKKRIQYFTNETQLFATGFPRTGNTFLTYLIREAFPEVIFVHHLHTIASIKIALKKKISVCVLLRDPYNCISSNYLKFYASTGLPEEINKELLSDICNEYFEYHDFVLKNRTDLDILDFNVLASKPDVVLKRLSEKFNLEISERRLQDIVKYSVPLFSGAKDTLGSSKPNPIKERIKQSIIESLTSFKEFNRCVTIYESFSSIH